MSDQATDEIELANILRVRSVEEGFWNRLDGSLSSGFNYTQSSAVATFTFDADVRSRTPRWEREASLSAYVTDQESGRTSRDDLTFQTLRLYKARWFSLFLAALQRNEELGIDLRTLAAAGAGRHVVQTNHAQLTLAGGLTGINEQVNGESSETSAAALGMVSWSVFRYDRPETDLTMSFLVFPGITVSGRVRGELDVSLKREISKDFFWSLSAYESYDTKPASAEAHPNDCGVANSFGWTF